MEVDHLNLQYIWADSFILQWCDAVQVLQGFNGVTSIPASLQDCRCGSREDVKLSHVCSHACCSESAVKPVYVGKTPLMLLCYI